MSNDDRILPDPSPANKPETIADKNFADRSAVAQEIIRRKSGFFERWALLLFLIMLLLLVAGTWFIKYPDTVEAGAVLMSNQPPATILSKGGTITGWLAANKRDVKRGEILFSLESAADIEEVAELIASIDSSINRLAGGKPGPIPSLFNKQFTRLGELQLPYQIFHTTLQQYNDRSANRHDLLQQQLMVEQALQNLKSQVDQWLQQYAIQAPADGSLTWAMPLRQNQYLQPGQLLGYVNPTGNSYYAQIKLPQASLGKIDSGMAVQIRLDAYPYQEAGFIPGTLDHISGVVTDSQFVVTARLDSGLVTSRQKNISFTQGLKARALIITKDRRLLQRLYYSVVKTRP